MGNHSSPHNHRGFGFVIFEDANAIELLLGNAQSRFLILPDGRKLEVKRAVSSSNMRAAGELQTLITPTPSPTTTTPMTGWFPGSNSQVEQIQPPVQQPSPQLLQVLPQQAV